MAKTPDGATDPDAVARRNFLRKLLGGGAVAAAGAAGASALLAEPAGAADTDPILIGQGNANNNPGGTTQLSGSTNIANTPLLEVEYSATDTQAGTQAVFAEHAGGGANVVAMRAEATGAGAGTTAVRGRTTGAGVGTTSVAGIAEGANAFGVVGQANTGAGMRVVPDGGAVPMPPSTGTWSAGSMRADDNGDVWYCYADGAGAASGWYPLSLIPAFVPLAAPERVYDSRPGFPPTNVPKGKLNPNQERDVDIFFNPTNISPFAFAVLMNLTIGDTVGGGFLAVFSADVSWPGTSNINWFATNQALANNATTAISQNGEFTVRCGGTGGTHFVVDIAGYYTLTA